MNVHIRPVESDETLARPCKFHTPRVEVAPMKFRGSSFPKIRMLSCVQPPNACADMLRSNRMRTCIESIVSVDA
jgi:hypothetical protein